MVSSKFTARYRLIVVSVFLLSLILGVMPLLLSTPNLAQSDFWTTPHSLLILLASLAIIGFGCLPLLYMKTIQIEAKRIIFRNYLMPSLKEEVDFKSYDYYKIIHEESENGVYETVWLIKNGKLKASFSTFQYANYHALESALKLKYDGILDLSPIRQLWCRLGGSII